MPIKVNNVEITDDDVFREMQYQTDAPNGGTGTAYSSGAPEFTPSF